MDRRDADHDAAASEAGARSVVLDAGAAALPRAPWLSRRQPPSAIDLISYALWRGAAGTASEEMVLAALTLLPAARAEVDQIEAAALLEARSRGMSWPRISRALGLASAQAAQQRLGRLAGRVEGLPTRDSPL